MASVYVDTNALIRLVEEDHSELSDLVEGRLIDEVRFITSELTLAEALVGPMHTGSMRLASIYEGLLANSAMIQTIAIDRSVLRKSAEIRATLGGKLPNAIHVATAVLSGCAVVLSSDRRLRVPASLRRVAIEDVDQMGKWI